MGGIFSSNGKSVPNAPDIGPAFGTKLAKFTEESVTKIEEMKLGKKYSFLTFKIVDKEIVVDEKGEPEDDYNTFLNALFKYGSRLE